jgi:hypothetical protein
MRPVAPLIKSSLSSGVTSSPLIHNSAQQFGSAKYSFKRSFTFSCLVFILFKPCEKVKRLKNLKTAVYLCLLYCTVSGVRCWRRSWQFSAFPTLHTCAPCAASGSIIRRQLFQESRLLLLALPRFAITLVNT